MSIIPATLTGLAVGDALGMPFETEPQTSQRLRQWDGTYQADHRGHHPLDAGQWTDDTQMATALAQSLVEAKTYCPADVTRRYVRLWSSQQMRGIGHTTATAMERLVGGVPWCSAGSQDSRGNGAAMRIAPLGLFFRDYGHAVRTFATMDAAITHNNLEAREGSKAVALAVMYLAGGMNPKDALLQAFAKVDHTSLLKARLMDALLMVVNMEPSREQLLDDLTRVGTHCDVTQTVPAAFLAFLGTRCFRDAVEVAIRAGGDTDTTAAITGALAGTYYGTQEVDPYLADLEDGQKLRELEGSLLERPSRPYD